MTMETNDMNMVQRTLHESARVGAMKHLAAKKKVTAEQIEHTAQEFEAMFLSEMMSHMMDGVIDSDGPMGGGHAEDIYRSFLNDEYAKIMSRSGGVGVADMVKREMLKLQEVA